MNGVLYCSIITRESGAGIRGLSCERSGVEYERGFIVVIAFALFLVLSSVMLVITVVVLKDVEELE
jgi:hypothetical protein